MKTISIILALDGSSAEAEATVERACRRAACLPWQADVLVACTGDPIAGLAPTPVPVRQIRAPDGGSATRAAVLASAGDYVLVAGRGAAVPVSEVRRLVPHLERGAQAAVGSRCLGRWAGSLRPAHATINVAIRYLLLEGIRDTLSGFTCYAGPVARQVYALARAGEPAVDIEALALARALGYTVTEAPIDAAAGGTEGRAPSLLSVLAIRRRLSHRAGGRMIRRATSPGGPT